MSAAGSKTDGDRATARLGPTVAALTAVADQIKLTSVADQLSAQRALLDQDTLRVIVLGRFRTGKSTFLNALLCELTHPVPELGDSGPLPVKDLPTTAALTTIDYAPVPRVTVVKRDGTRQEWSLAQFRTESTIRSDPEENRRSFNDISLIQVYFPSRTLQSGITLLDSPGTDDIRERTEIVEAAVQRCDAAIVLLRSDAIGMEDEREFIQSVRACGLTDVFFVINRRDGRVVDSELKEEAWNRVVAMALGGPWYEGQDLSQERIYFVDAREALKGRLKGNGRLTAESGLETFERSLSDYLEKERRPAHIRRFVQAADVEALAITQSLQAQIQLVQAQLERLRSPYDQVAAVGEVLRAAEQSKGRIGALVAIAQRKAEYALGRSFGRMIEDLCRDLPADLEREPIPALGATDPLAELGEAEGSDQVLVPEVAAAREVYERHLAAWRDDLSDRRGIRKALEGIPEEMLRMMEDEVQDLFGPLEQFQAENPRAVFGRPTAAPQAGRGPGTLGAELVEEYRDRLVRRATGAALFFGVPNLWSELVDAVSGGTVPGIAPGFDRRNPVHRRQLADWLIPRLRRLPEEFTPRISGMMEDAFAGIGDSLAATLDRVVAAGLGDRLGAFLQVASEIQARRKSLSEVERLGAEVAHHREELRKLLAEIEADRL
jgi:hypothetical protein